MDSIAYTHSYLVREEMEGIEYEFPDLDLLAVFPWHNAKTLAWSSLVCATVIAGVLNAADPAFAQRQMLTRGMQGNDVAEVQTQLRNRGYTIRYGANGGGRGKFGPQTEAAVRAFQRSVGLTPDGIIGPRTRGALTSGSGGTVAQSSSNAAAGSGSSGNLRLGSRGAAVEQLQTMLRNKGYTIRYGANGAGRGVFGPETLNAVRQFQASAGLAVDGIAGPRTMGALRNGGNIAVRAATASTGGNLGTQGRYRVTAQSGLRIRSGPGTNFPTIGSLATNAVVNVQRFPNSSWAQIGSGQFVASRYITQ